MRLLTLALAGVLILGGCGGSGDDDGEPAPEVHLSVRDSSTVTVHFTITVDGEVVQDTRSAQPFTYVQGRRQLFPALEAGLVGLEVGGQRQITLAPDQAFGARDPAAIQTVPRDSFGYPESLLVGTIVQGNPGGRPVQALVTEIGDETVTLDMNHPLAGKTLVFDVEILDIK
jgi:FKBP-type peptidyl-prolyl cis-trans isomerase SlyD